MSTSTAELPAEQLYARLLSTAVQHAAAGGPPAPRVRVRSADGRSERLPLERWLAPSSGADHRIVALARAPVLDVGCGPGRLPAALAAAGKDALGLDLVPTAVRIARSRGGRAIQGSVFSDVPQAGRWQTALLLDGNIGIGGWPAALLARISALLAPGGEAIVELDPPGTPTCTTRLRIEADHAVSEWFAWARVSVDGVAGVAAGAGLAVVDPFEDSGRWFARLARP